MLRITLALCLIACSLAQEGELDDTNRTTPQIIESRGFLVETHEVKTKDGYFLSLHRIVNPELADSKKIAKPVLLQHGLMAASSGWVVVSEGPDVKETANIESVLPDDIGNNLGFELSMRGYDVWLGNSRGNAYSMKHETLDNKAKAYWDFSFDEKIEFDIPASIDYILEATKQEQLSYVGHSQGTLVMFGLLATQKEYNAKVKPFIAMAPVTSVPNMKSPIRFLANFFIRSFLERRGGTFLPAHSTMNLLSAWCPASFGEFCNNLIFLLTGYNEDQVIKDRQVVLRSHLPSGATSNKNMVHYAQGVSMHKKFAKYDYGKKKNVDKYGQEAAPEYMLEEITNEYICLMSSENDWLASPPDVKILRERLNVTLMEDYVVPLPKWNHLDFVIARETGKYINSRIIDLLKKAA